MGMHAHGTCCPKPWPSGTWPKARVAMGHQWGHGGQQTKGWPQTKPAKLAKWGASPIAPTGHPTALWAFCKAAPKAVCKAASCKASCAAMCSHIEGLWGVARRPQLAHAARRAGAQNNKLRSSGAPTTHATGCAVLCMQLSVLFFEHLRVCSMHVAVWGAPKPPKWPVGWPRLPGNQRHSQISMVPIKKGILDTCPPVPGSQGCNKTTH